MKKDAYYFSHDANAQDDPKVMLLIEQMGMEGTGIYWCLVEKLRSEKDYTLPLSVLPSFAHRWHTSVEKVQTVVKNYGLFKIVKEKFFSVRLKNSMLEKTEKARLSASARWGDANAMRTNSKRNANGMRIDAIKGKESKRKEIAIFSPSGKLNTGYTLLPDGGYSGPNDKGQQSYFDNQGRELDYNGNLVK